MTPDEADREYFLIRPAVLKLVDQEVRMPVYWRGLTLTGSLQLSEAFKRAEAGTAGWKEGIVKAYRLHCAKVLASR